MNKISSNGRYSVGFQQYNWSFMVDNDTWETTMIYSPDVETVEGPSNECNVYDISNDGTMVGLFYSPDVLMEYEDDQGNVLRFSELIPGVYRNGRWTPLKRLEEVPMFGSGLDGVAQCITGDGTKIGGGVHLGQIVFGPATWSGTEYGDLTQYSAPANGGLVKDISDDGKVMAGWLIGDDGSRIPTQWVDGEPMNMGSSGEVYTVSPNGKWSGGYIGGFSDGVPFVWSSESGIELLEVPAGMNGGMVSSVADDGTTAGYFYISGFGQIRFPFIITPDGTKYDLDEYLEDRYGYTIPQDLLGEYADAPNEYLNTPQEISADGTVICGWNALRQPWVIRLGKPTDK